MFDISIYGHLTVDRIITLDGEQKSLGAMANVWNDLIILDNKLKIGLSPIYFGESLILVDKIKCERTSKSILNVTEILPKINNSKINHLMYINNFDNFDFIKDINGIITADTCSGKPLELGVLKYIDYLFVSDEEHWNIDLLKNNIKGYIILHSPTGSKVYNQKENIFQYKIDSKHLLENVNVLGAGDTFAACFLYNLISNSSDIKNNIEFAHQKTYEILKFKNET